MLDLKLGETGDEQFPALLRGVIAAAQTVLTTAVKVDENRLRATAIDKMPDLLRIIHDEEMKLVG